MAWTLDVDKFRDKSELFGSIQHANQAVLSVASTLEVIQEMARVDPDQRASTAQMLVKCFDGKGLASPRSRVPPIIPIKLEIRTEIKIQPAFSPQDTDRSVRRPERPKKQDTNRCRVNKARFVQPRFGHAATAVNTQMKMLRAEKPQLPCTVTSPRNIQALRLRPRR
ncbi:hypothetical protein N7523_005542 [Penicillium sp. IBT 18751x]|nr:hypothetical protein N7523_005872 [Penicillium sp. IBT 18751x]KAJ6117791.1 hypothetical protein N7523_005542 [Penicillium sp. IBT 18751x]